MSNYKAFFDTEQAGYPIKAEISNSGRIIKVTYGLQVDTTRSYSEACALIGQAIMHAACCESKLNSDKLES